MLHHRSVPSLPLGLACLLTVSLIGWGVMTIADHGGGAEATPASRGIVVVEGRPDTGRHPSPRPDVMRPGPSAETTSSAQRTIAEVTRVYPLLRDAAMECHDDHCALTGLILPPTDKDYLARRQEMLVGGLASLVSRDGYAMEGPPRLDEIEDNTFRLHASLTRNPNG